MTFQLSDLTRLLPEVLLAFWGLIVLLFDVFGRWRRTEEGRRAQADDAAFMTMFGLVIIWIVAFIQSGYGFEVSEPTADVWYARFQQLLYNLRQGGAASEAPLLGYQIDTILHIARLTVIGAALLTVMFTRTRLPQRSPGEFYALIIYSTLGMCIMSGAVNLLLVYLAIELTSIPLYVLAGYFKDDRRSAEGGMKYFLVGALSSGILLYGISLIFGLTGFLDLPQIASAARGEPSALLTMGMIFFIAGMGYKIAVVPFHAWAPDVYQGAPTAITGFLSTASKTAGFLVLFRVLGLGFEPLAGSAARGPEFGGWTSLLGLLALLTVLFGNLAALPQSNVKRLLAYSSIGHAGFLLLSMLGTSVLSTSALLYYLVIYTLTNLGAFGALTVIGEQIGSDEIGDLHGVSIRSPLLGMLLTVLLLSLAGVPPLGGFFAKFYVFMAAWNEGAYWLVVVGVLMTLVSLYYYLRVLRAIFIEVPATDTPLTTSRWPLAGLAITCALVLLLGIFPSLLLNPLEAAAAGVALR